MADAPKNKVHSANIPRPEARPLQLYVLCDADPNAGRAHSLIAMAHAVAKRTPAVIHEYYNLQKPARWSDFWKEKPHPDIIFQDGLQLYSPLVNDREVFVARRHDYNENERLPPSQLRFTDPLAEREKFLEKHPQIRTPLIALCVANPNNPSRVRRALGDLMSRYTSGTIYAISSPRTDRAMFENEVAQAQADLQTMGKPDLHLLSHSYDPEAAYNPYTGLIHTADAVVLLDVSQSMLSDVLSSNATPYAARWKPKDIPIASKVKGEFPIQHRVKLDSTAGLGQKILDDYHRHQAYRGVTLPF